MRVATDLALMDFLLLLRFTEVLRCIGNIDVHSLVYFRIYYEFGREMEW